MTAPSPARLADAGKPLDFYSVRRTIWDLVQRAYPKACRDGRCQEVTDAIVAEIDRAELPTPPFDAGTPDEIEQRVREIRELRESVSEAPWSVVRWNVGEREMPKELRSGFVASTGAGDRGRFYVVSAQPDAWKPNGAERDAAFIAAAPQIVDDLLGLVSQLRARSSGEGHEQSADAKDVDTPAPSSPRTHTDRRWCDDLHCKRCYSADVWVTAEVARAQALLAASQPVSPSPLSAERIAPEPDDAKDAQWHEDAAVHYDKRAAVFERENPYTAPELNPFANTARAHRRAAQVLRSVVGSGLSVSERTPTDG